MSSSNTATADADAENLHSYFARLTLPASNASTSIEGPERSHSATSPGSSHDSSTFHSSQCSEQPCYSPSPAEDCSICGTPMPPPSIASLFPGAPPQNCQGCGNPLLRSRRRPPGAGDSPRTGRWFCPSSNSMCLPRSPPRIYSHLTASSSPPADPPISVPQRAKTPRRSPLAPHDRRHHDRCGRDVVHGDKVTRGTTRISKIRNPDPRVQRQRGRSPPGKPANNDQGRTLRVYGQRERKRSTVVEALQRWEQDLGQQSNANTAAFSDICSCHLFGCRNVKLDPGNSYKGPLPAPRRSQMQLQGYPPACDRCFARLMKAHNQDILFLSERLWEWCLYGDRDSQHSGSVKADCNCRDCEIQRLLTEPLHAAVELKRAEAQILRPNLEDPCGLEGLKETEGKRVEMQIEALSATVEGLSINIAGPSETPESQHNLKGDMDVDGDLKNIEEELWDKWKFH